MQSKTKRTSKREACAKRRGSAARAVAVAITLMLLAPAAFAGTTTLRWTHPDPASVDGFRVHTSVAGAGYDSGVDVAKPAPDASGIYMATVPVPDGVQVDLKMSAYSFSSGLASSLSANSNSLFLLGAPGQPMVVLP